MIQVLGIKRIMLLIILIAANAALAAGIYMYIMPEKQKLDTQLKMTRAQISEKRSEADRLRNEFQEIQSQKAFFESLDKAGFLSDQNRLVARRRIMDIQKFAKVLRAGYNIDSAKVTQHAAAGRIDHVILDSLVKVDIDALDDIDFYAFVYWMENAFPGHISVRKVRLERVMDINETTLRAIGTGTPAVMVRGNMELSWRTMVSEGKLRTSDGFGGGGF